MTAAGYSSDTEDIVKASWSNFQHDCVAAIVLSETSPLPPALSATDLPGGWTQAFTARQIRRINQHPAESGQDSSAESLSNTENWLDWNGDIDNPYESKAALEADDESDVQQDNAMEDPDSPNKRDVSAAQNVPGLILQTRRSNKMAEKVLMTVNALETRRNTGHKIR